MIRGQVVLVTGAARGIGRHIAHTFAAEGARLAIADLRSLDQVSEELRKMGADTLAVQADVCSEDAVRTMMRTVADHFGRIDVLVNNAAIPTHSSWEPIWPAVRDMDKSFWDQIIDTNLGGTFLCTKHVLPYMEERRSGHVLNVFGGGNVKSVGACVYVVSKEAVRTFTRYVAEEERDSNICILILTPGGEIATEEAPEAVRQRLPGVELVANRFVLAAQAGMDLSGQLLTLKDGELEVVP
jgi:3-oxoacyl-[acyl-carrier protein] reductase